METVLSRALRSAIGMREKVVVAQLDPEALGQPERLETLAANFALLRALDIRLIVVCDFDGAGGWRPQEQTAVLRLSTAISRHGQRSLMLPTAGVISVHKLMVATPVAPSGDGTVNWSATPVMAPMYVPVVDQVILTQLCSLRYIPILLLPVVDEAGQVVAMPADEVGAAVAKFMEAALLIYVRSDETTAVPAAASGRRTIVSRAATQDELFSDIFQVS